MDKQIFVPVLSIFLLALFGSEGAAAQQKQSEELKVSIQFRPRAEMRNGLFTPILRGQDPATFIAQRTRIGVVYSKNPKIRVGLSTQVVNTWGNDPQVQKNSDEVTLYEAWAQLTFNPEWSIKVGRQVLSYDDERLLGALDWNNAARKHDAALLAFKNSEFTGNLVLAFNQNSERVTSTFYNDAGSQPYKAMEMLWMKYKFSDALSASALFLNLDMQNRFDSTVSHLQTLGANVFYNKDELNIIGTFYYQAGNTPVKNFPSGKTAAWMAAAKANFQVSKKFSIGIGSDLLSGKDMNSTSPRITFFNPLFGTQHKFYGFMDYFYVSSPHKNVGLWDTYLDSRFAASNKLDLNLALHHFEAAARVMDYSGAKASAALGNEMDITFNYKIMEAVKLSGGYSQMFTNASMKYVKDISPFENMKSLQNWVWLSVNITPEILIMKRDNEK